MVSTFSAPRLNGEGGGCGTLLSIKSQDPNNSSDSKTRCVALKPQSFYLRIQKYHGLNCHLRQVISKENIFVDKTYLKTKHVFRRRTNHIWRQNLVKSLFWQPPSPFRGVKKNSSGNGLKWQENWSTYFFTPLGDQGSSFNLADLYRTICSCF